MGKAVYSIACCRELTNVAEGAGLRVPVVKRRYEQGDLLDLSFVTVWPEVEGRGRFLIEKFAGGGFAGQVYRCRLEHLDDPDAAREHGLAVGGIYAVKIMLPPTRCSRAFRDLVYWLGFQAPFSAAVNRGACRGGLIWQKLARIAAGVEFGDEDAVADVYASFYDSDLSAHGEIREWVEGRTWRLEPDINPGLRRNWARVDPGATGSPEYVAKRQFMARFVKMLHAMGAAELARQYEWWTMKSQPNVLKRANSDDDPASGLCAVDFRAGLALLPFLPMSPVDVRLILRGLRRGALVQFDRCEMHKLRAFAAGRQTAFREWSAMIDALERYDREYRRAQPDIAGQGWRLITDRELRKDVRGGLICGYKAAGLIDESFAGVLTSSPAVFSAFYLLGAIPALGRFVRRLWGNGGYRAHVKEIVKDRHYFRRAMKAGLALRLVDWHRAGRVGEERAGWLLDHPVVFWLQALTIRIFPAVLHRCLAEPSWLAQRIRNSWRFMRKFYGDAGFREKWFTDLVMEGYRDGMLRAGERDSILQRVQDPFIVKYLKSLAVHFATLPVTQVISLITATVVLVWVLVRGGTWLAASGWFVAILAFFQVTPISPGSICRGLYVVYLMIREKNFKDYMIAAPVAFVKYLGYLAFPFQMITTYPALSQFMGARGATSIVNRVPVFGEKGALLEHMIFDLFFNKSRMLGRWAQSRMRVILSGWMLIGVLVLFGVFRGCEWELTSKGGINLIIAVVALCFLPRLVFYPLHNARTR